MERSARCAALTLAMVAVGCGNGKKDPKAWVKDHEADYAALDATISKVTAAIKTVPERTLATVPRCKPSPAYKYGSNAGEADTLGLLLDGLGPTTANLNRVLDTREGGHDTSAAITMATPDIFGAVQKLTHFVVLRRHTVNASDVRITADLFVVEASTAKIVCAFGFVGPEKQYASEVQVTGTTDWVDRKTGKVVRSERTTTGGGGGTSADLEASNALGPVLGRNLGIAIYSPENLQATKGLGYDGTTRIEEVLSDRNTAAPRPTITRGDRGVWSQWTVGPIELQLYDFTEAQRVALGAAQAVDAGDDAEGKELAAKLVATPAANADEIVARAAPLGWKASRGASVAQPDKRVDEYTIALENGKAKRTLWILDFGPGIRKIDGRGARIEGRRVLTGKGVDPVAGTAGDVVAEVFDGVP